MLRACPSSVRIDCGSKFCDTPRDMARMRRFPSSKSPVSFDSALRKRLQSPTSPCSASCRPQMSHCVDIQLRRDQQSNRPPDEQQSETPRWSAAREPQIMSAKQQRPLELPCAVPPEPDVLQDVIAAHAVHHRASVIQLLPLLQHVIQSHLDGFPQAARASRCIDVGVAGIIPSPDRGRLQRHVNGVPDPQKTQALLDSRTFRSSADPEVRETIGAPKCGAIGEAVLEQQRRQ